MIEGRLERYQEPDFSVTVYFDPFNRRIRIDDYLGDIDKILLYCESIAKEEKTEKLVVKTKFEHFKKFIENGFRLEGIIDGYFLGTDCYFFSKFYTVNRSINTQWIKEEEIIQSIVLNAKSSLIGNLPTDYRLKKLTELDTEKLANLYKQVFEIYPTPLNKPEYIKKTMNNGTIYYGMEYNGAIISAASAEVNDFYKNAELTDCATLKDYRKYGLMKFILIQLEGELKSNGIYCAYSIARSLSYGMNAVLQQLNYSYRGRLINNCFIYDKLEDMNVWTKSLV
ncbi:putative beta-lysine N-acetyltransferase [Bacillus sp. B15-48]|uniref:putative beta-lysine N-acetyltransferase n=1 Tax=Bacillus sp. B15-48 TaxID=1548601 RepID=UPI00193ED138|nr:putative beta-lysine N-acetyltransferase [Bacillus sp. B15-48]MBM4762020.1 putative beta-lysine N-acetyltransferase [Bacillus sp. B15-48]